jgi:DNA invertase Pin-like site-specific DNA recombinase
VARQRRECEALAAELGWSLVVVHDQDSDVSAFSGKYHKGSAALLDDLKQGRIDAVIA